MDGEDELLHGALSALLEGSLQPDLREPPLQVIPATGPCRKILYTTKIQWLRSLALGTAGSLDSEARFPEDVAIVWRSGPLGGAHRALVRAVASTLAAPMWFIGDLDPLDLVTFATMAEPGASPLPTASYLGVDSPWLDRCDQDIRSQRARSIQAVCVPLGDDERHGLERLQQLPIDWAGLVGPSAWALLQSGLKLELEGASNPRLYSSGLRDELLQIVFG
ncbi:MAG TPA: hypothetical protein VF310_04820 [Vicinamibacteria bacterium]